MKGDTDDTEKQSQNQHGGSRVPRSHQKDKPPGMGPGVKALDGGWGWVVILGTVLAHVIYGVMVRSFGIIYLAMLEKYRGTPSATGWIGAINIAACGILGPLTTNLCVRFSHRTVTIVGGIIMAVGVLISAYSPNLTLLYISYGLISGAGLSMTYTPGFLIIGQYFDKRRGLAMGIANFGSGIGTLVFPPLMIMLFDEYGYTGALIIMAGLCLQCCISGALFRPLAQNRAPSAPPLVHVKETEMKELKYVKTVLNEELKEMKETQGLETVNNEETEKEKDTETQNNEEEEIMEEYEKLLAEADKSFQEEFELSKGMQDDNNTEVTETVEAAINGANCHAGDRELTQQELSCDMSNQRDLKGEVCSTELKALNGQSTANDATAKTYDNFQTKKTKRKFTLCCCRSKPSDEQTAGPKKPPLFDIELIKDKRFVATCVVIFSAAQALALTSGFLPALAVEYGASPTNAAFLLSISGMSSSVGGLVLGAMMDMKKIKPYRVNLFSIYSFMVGLNTVLNPLARNYYEFVILCILRAGFAGVMVAQRATIVADLVGPRKVPNAFGWLLFFFSLGSLFGRAIGGTLKDALGSYGAPFYVSGGMSLVCCFIFTIFTLPPAAWRWLLPCMASSGKQKNNEALV